MPLIPEYLRLWTDDVQALETALGCSCRAEQLDGDFSDIVRGQADIASRDPENYLWHSFWLIIRRSDSVTVGSADFKRPPDGRGEVEIGYGLGKQFEHCGYMTEAVRAMCAWAFGHEAVSAVIAETERDNTASHRVLERCGFTVRGGGETLWWSLTKPAC